MADDKVLSVDGKPVNELRVVDLKKELEKNGLSKSGSKKELLDRLKAHLNLERLRQKSLQAGDQAPSLQVKEDMGKNDFIKQYMAQRDEMFKMQMEEKKNIEEEEKRKQSASEDEGHVPRKRTVPSNSESETDVSGTDLSPPALATKKPRQDITTAKAATPCGKTTESMTQGETAEEKNRKKITRRSLQDLGPNSKDAVSQLEKNKDEPKISETGLKKSEEINPEKKKAKTDANDSMSHKTPDKIESKKKEDKPRESDSKTPSQEKSKEVSKIKSRQKQSSKRRHSESGSSSSESDSDSSNSSSSESEDEKYKSKSSNSHKRTIEKHEIAKIPVPKSDHEKPAGSKSPRNIFSVIEDAAKGKELSKKAEDKQIPLKGKEETSKEMVKQKKELEPTKLTAEKPKEKEINELPKESEEKQKELPKKSEEKQKELSQKSEEKQKELSQKSEEKQKELPKKSEEKQKEQSKPAVNIPKVDTPPKQETKQYEIDDAHEKNTISVKSTETPVTDKPSEKKDETHKTPKESTETTTEKECPTKMDVTDGKEKKEIQQSEKDQASKSEDAKKTEKMDVSLTRSSERRKEPPTKRSKKSRSRSSSSSSSNSRSRSRSSRSSSSSRSSRSGSSSRSRSRSPAKEKKSPEDETPKKMDLSRSSRDESYYTAHEDMSMDLGHDNRETEKSSVAENLKADDKTFKVPDEAEKPLQKQTSSASTGSQPPKVRKRKWGSTRTASKKSSISISTDSLKGIIDIKPGALSTEAVLDLGTDPDAEEDFGDIELRDNDEKNENIPKARNKDKPREKARESINLQRTVTQDVKEKKAETGVLVEDERHVSMETDNNQDNKSEETEVKKDAEEIEEDSKSEPAKLTRRIISRESRDQAPVTTIPADEPLAAKRAPSPPRNPKSVTIHVRHLVRPYTLGQLKELLGRSGTLLNDGFWIDKIKSHCFATYETEEQATTARQALHNTKWPSSNPKQLRVDFATQEEFDFYKRGEEGPFTKDAEKKAAPVNKDQKEKERLERERKRKEEAAEREKAREKERKEREEKREKQREVEREKKKREHVREWDRDKIRQSASRSRSRERAARGRDRIRSGDRGKDDRGKPQEDRRRERSKERKERKEKKAEDEEPPAKLLDDLFRKTKATPCIYWLPLTEEQVLERDNLKKQKDLERERLREERHRQQEADEKNKQDRSGDRGRKSKDADKTAGRRGSSSADRRR